MMNVDYENRNARRVPVNCQVKLKNPDTQEVFYGTAKNLSVEDISFESSYVPRFGELLEITVAPATSGPSTQPLCAVIQVYKCVQSEAARTTYEIGGAFRKILQ